MVESSIVASFLAKLVLTPALAVSLFDLNILKCDRRRPRRFCLHQGLAVICNNPGAYSSRSMSHPERTLDYILLLWNF